VQPLSLSLLIPTRWTPTPGTHLSLPYCSPRSTHGQLALRLHGESWYSTRQAASRAHNGWHRPLGLLPILPSFTRLHLRTCRVIFQAGIGVTSWENTAKGRKIRSSFSSERGPRSCSRGSLFFPTYLISNIVVEGQRKHHHHHLLPYSTTSRKHIVTDKPVPRKCFEYSHSSHSLSLLLPPPPVNPHRPSTRILRHQGKLLTHPLLSSLAYPRHSIPKPTLT
jgi:hypothetical protein